MSNSRLNMGSKLLITFFQTSCWNKLKPKIGNSNAQIKTWFFSLLLYIILLAVHVLIIEIQMIYRWYHEYKISVIFHVPIIYLLYLYY